MVPGDFLRVHHIPMTMTGKTGRKTLRKEVEELFVARFKNSADHCTEHQGGLTTALADTLRLLCEKTLGVPLQSLRHDIGWLQLGGDSLFAMKLVDQARGHGLSLSVLDVLGAKSLAQLASKAKNEVVALPFLHVESFGLLPIDSDLKETVIRNALEQCRVPLSSLEDLYPCTAHQLVSIPYMIKAYVISPSDYDAHFPQMRIKSNLFAFGVMFPCPIHFSELAS